MGIEEKIIYMNVNRRKSVKFANELVYEALSIIESVRDEEQESIDNLPESLQYSERAEIMNQFIDIFDDVLSSLEDINSQLLDIYE